MLLVQQSMLSGSVAQYCEGMLKTTDSNHNTPLHIACKKGNMESLKVQCGCGFVMGVACDGCGLWWVWLIKGFHTIGPATLRHQTRCKERG